MEQVILVDIDDREVGTMEKMEAHEKALLHRAFSVFVFNDLGELLLQKRASGKYHSGGLWTNTCCSHQRPGESTLEAANRRMVEEMGFSTELHEEFSFTYKSVLNDGLTEHEFDHVLFGSYNGRPKPNPEEVEDWKYVALEELNIDIQNNPDQYTSWFKICWAEVLKRRSA